MIYKGLFVWSLQVMFFMSQALAQDVLIEVDTHTLTLSVMYKKQTLLTFNNIAIGRNGAGFKQKQGDDITPIGDYRIGWINNDSIYYRFYGFNYPSLENAAQAFQEKLITQDDYNQIRLAHHNAKVPPQQSPLGGRLGIHGLGKADINIHQMMNWTHGCIALTNEQIDQLHPWLTKGTRVRVK